MYQNKNVKVSQSSSLQEDKTKVTESKRCFNAWKQGLGILLLLVDILNNNNIIEYIDISSSLCYSELFFYWIKNTNSLCRATKAHLKVAFHI